MVASTIFQCQMALVFPGKLRIGNGVESIGSVHMCVHRSYSVESLYDNHSKAAPSSPLLPLSLTFPFLLVPSPTDPPSEQNPLPSLLTEPRAALGLWKYWS